jgi:hypothetical protein
MSMNHAQKRQDLAQADRHIVELKAHLVRQRILVKYVRDTGQPSHRARS